MPDTVHVNGNPLALAGLTQAQNECLRRIDGDEAMKETAQWAGKITLHDKRVVDVGVIVRLSEEQPNVKAE